MIKRILFLVIIISNLLSFNVFAESTEYEASFRVNGEALSTVAEYLKRVRGLYPEIQVSVERLESVEYNGAIYKGLKLVTEGMLAGDKVSQSLTYIMAKKDLWRMLFVESKSCVIGRALENGEWTTGWKCKSSDFPLTGAMSDIFLVKDENVDIEELSRNWGREVIVNVGAPIEEAPEDEVVPTLGDMRQLLLSKEEGVWRAEAATWEDLKSKEQKPALRIFIKAKMGTYWIEQQLLYIYSEEGLLVLKEIDGKHCRFVERVNKNICDPNYEPSSLTPFTLIDSTEVSGALEQEGSESENVVPEESIRFSCGNVMSNYESALRFHFKNSILNSADIDGHKMALDRIPSVVDPQGVFLQGITVSDEIGRDQLVDLIENLKKGTAGSCDVLLPLFEKIRAQLLEGSADLQELIGKVRRKEVGLGEGFTGTVRQQAIWNLIESFVNPALQKVSSEIALDVAAENAQRYYKRALDLVHGGEELLTAAYVNLDAYSSLLGENMITIKDVSLRTGADKPEYFGLSVASGLSGHYILTIHPNVAKEHGIQVGDEIKRVNGVGAQKISAQALDTILLDTDNKINLSLRRPSRRFNLVQLEAQPLDMMKLFYTVDLVNVDVKKYVKVKIKEFHLGLSESLRAELLRIIGEVEVDGYIIDLQGNPGGNIDEALKIANFFIGEGVLSYYRVGYRGAGDFRSLEADESLLISETAPVVVQVDKSTASSAETLAATLKAYQRATIIGGRTFGKQVAQHYAPVELSNEQRLAMLITSTEYFDANGLSLNGKGVGVDVELASTGAGVFDDGNGLGEDLEVTKVQSYGGVISESNKVRVLEGVLQGWSIDRVATEILSVQ